FPITLVGEKYLVIARTPRRLIRPEKKPHPLFGEPLWWREIPYDYEFLGPTGRVLLPPNGKDGFWEIGSEHRDVDSFQKAALVLLNLTADEQEAYFLRLESRRAFTRRLGHMMPAPPKNLHTESEVHRLLRKARNASDEQKDSIRGALSHAGGRVTLGVLEGFPL